MNSKYFNQLVIKRKKIKKRLVKAFRRNFTGKISKYFIRYAVNKRRKMINNSSQAEKDIIAIKEFWFKSILKSISWRIIGTIDTMVISYFITGKFSYALSIGGIELMTKMFFYVLHERLWYKFKWIKK